MAKGCKGESSTLKMWHHDHPRIACAPGAHGPAVLFSQSARQNNPPRLQLVLAQRLPVRLATQRAELIHRAPPRRCALDAIANNDSTARRVGGRRSKGCSRGNVSLPALLERRPLVQRCRMAEATARSCRSRSARRPCTASADCGTCGWCWCHEERATVRPSSAPDVSGAPAAVVGIYNRTWRWTCDRTGLHTTVTWPLLAKYCFGIQTCSRSQEKRSSPRTPPTAC